MRSVTPCYPVDRYLVESSKNIEMVNIIDDDLWNPEPALRPEDEILLRKLHEMLQSTADDLKLLSGELSKFHEPGVQVITAPTPLDEEFNEKVHIEEVVNAKFHGYKIKDQQTPCEVEFKPRRDVITTLKTNDDTLKPKTINTDARVNTTSILKKPLNRNLGITRTKVIHINANNQDNAKIVKLNNGKVIHNAPTVAYNEISYKYIENKNNDIPRKALQVQEMPSINIRGELKEQKVLSLDILPDNNDNNKVGIHKSNIAVVSMKHETDLKQVPSTSNDSLKQNQLCFNNPIVRKVSKMSTGESSASSNISLDAQITQKTQKRKVTAIRTSPKISAGLDSNKRITANKKESDKRQHLNLDEWKKKLNTVYGPTKSKKYKVPPLSKSKTKKVSPKKPESLIKLDILKNKSEYIPYSQLTLGGVRVSDIEREISNIPNKKDLPLSPIVDKLLSSRENSFTECRQIYSPKILTTSDENLLHEVMDIEKTVSNTLSKNNIRKTVNEQVTKTRDASSGTSAVAGENRSYVDDFEEDKSENTEYQKRSSLSDDQFPDKSSSDYIANKPHNDNRNDAKPSSSKLQNTIITKVSNLSFKDSVDIFEFVHLVDTHDIAVQSNASIRISPKQTQTSPRTDKSNIQPIHNDLWPAMDPKGEVEKMFQLEKDFIKKLIVDEYGDLLEKNLTKPSTSKVCKEDCEKNVNASQKNTQTSPAHVKSVMTSPTRTKTRTTSPLVLSLPVDHQTSPLIFAAPQETIELEIENEDISINLSSPRFSLRLPHNSQEALSNLGACSNLRKFDMKSKILRKPAVGSSSSIDADNSSSELSSLGEIKLKLKRKLKKNRVPTVSESSSTSAVSVYSSDFRAGSILPLKSDGEVSLKQNNKKSNKSEGETSLGLSQ